MTTRHIKSGIASAAILISAAAAAAEDTPSVYSFGDSLSDTGNVETVTFGLEAGSEYFEGRFSNGFVWNDYFSQSVAGILQRTNPGLIGPFASGRQAGYNFAHGGAVSGNNGLNVNEFFGGRAVGTLLELIPAFVLTDQAEHFRDQRFFFRRTFRASEDDIATISSGGNDYFNGETDVDFVVGSIVRAIDIIEDNKINNFVVLDLPLVGDIPARAGDANQALLNTLSVQHNAALREALPALEARRGIDIVIVPVGELFNQIVIDADSNNGGVFGFTNVRAGEGTTGNCLGDGLVLTACPDTYLFYDSIHPTTRAHALVADLALGATLAESAAKTDAGARRSAFAQVNVAQNRVISARLNAAATEPSGTLALGDLALQTNLSSSVSGGFTFYRYTEGFVPFLVETTPGDDPLTQARQQRGTALSRGEYVSAHGTDGFVTQNLFVGALMTQSVRDNTALLSERRDEAVNYAAYVAWLAGPARFSLTTQSGRIEQSIFRETGFAIAPVTQARARSNYSITRLNAEWDTMAGPVPFTAIAKGSTARFHQDGYTERGGRGLVDVSVDERTDTGMAGYLGLRTEAGHRFSQGWRASLMLEGGGLMASSEQIGFGSLIDTNGLLQDTFNGQPIFADAIDAERYAGLLNADVSLSRNDRFSLGAQSRSLVTPAGWSHAVQARLALSF